MVLVLMLVALVSVSHSSPVADSSPRGLRRFSFTFAFTACAGIDLSCLAPPDSSSSHSHKETDGRPTAFFRQTWQFLNPLAQPRFPDHHPTEYIRAAPVDLSRLNR
jgi:hypothetical protein